jgi:hypothetical protein
MKLPRLATIVALITSLPACSSYFSDFYIANDTKGEISNLTVGDGRNVWNLGSLKPGGRARFYGHLSGEGGGAISWTAGGKRYSAEGCYFTGGSPAHGSVSVVGDHLEYRCT